MRQNALIRRLLAPFKHTPLHPQWFALREEPALLRDIARQAEGVVLDVGAGTQAIRPFLSPHCRYVSLDYYQTAAEWYGTRPQIFGDGQQLPMKAGSIDVVLLLDVLEHLPRPEACLAEISRVLRPGGRLILQVPFLYPLHDEPFDFHRWTRHGLRALAARHGFQIDGEQAFGHPLTTAALLTNLAWSKTMLNWLRRGNPLLLAAPLLLLIVPVVNLRAWLLARLSAADDFMPHGYRGVWIKQA
ncbi:MAG: methyltransferase domain-containing protein [Anaerolineales bacterium]|nr:methyltransferase domain-containing protein [Anaerolineales bacterium]